MNSDVLPSRVRSAAALPLMTPCTEKLLPLMRVSLDRLTGPSQALPLLPVRAPALPAPLPLSNRDSLIDRPEPTLTATVAPASTCVLPAVVPRAALEATVSVPAPTTVCPV